MDLLQKNIAWLSVAQIAKQIWEFIVGIILARILFPEDFGIYAIATVFYGFCQIFSNFGLTSVIIQEKVISTSFIKTTQSIITLLALLICFVLLFISSWISSFYGKPELKTILSVLSIFFLMNSFSIVPFGLLARQQRFNVISIFEIISSFCYGVVASVSAYLGHGVWSLVYGSAFSICAHTAMFSFYTKYFPYLGWNRQQARKILSLGGTLTISSFLNYFSRHLDYLIIGKMLGANALGIYKKAYDLATIAKEQAASIVARAFFPALTDIRNDKNSVKTLTLFYIKMIAYVCCPALIGLFCVAQEFILTVYGEKWQHSIVPLKIISIGAIFYSLISLFGSIFVTYEKKKWIVILETTYFVCLVVSVFIGIRWGVIGVSVGVLITILILTIAYLWFINQLINLSFADFLNAIKLPLFFSVIMGLGVTFLGNWFIFTLSLEYVLLKKICIGVVIYLILLSYTNDQDIVGIKRKLLEKLKK